MLSPVASSSGEAVALRFVVIPRFNMMTLTGLMEPPRIANYLSDGALYTLHFHSFDGGSVTASNGIPLACTPPPDTLNREDRVFVLGSWGGETYRNPGLFSWLRLQARLGVHLCGVEIGSYLLARAGLLAGKSATTHWSYLSGFQEQFPHIDTVEHLYTLDGAVDTCAGGTAGIDLMLHMIGERHGERLVGEISNQLMHHILREGATPQRLAPGRAIDAPTPTVRKAIEIIEATVGEPPRVPEIAQAVGLSQRQLERQFRKAVGCSVVQFGLLVRLQRARALLISTDLSVRDISADCGFNSLSHFAFAFRKCFGKRPSDYRQAWPEEEPEPHWPGSLVRYLDTLEARQRIDGGVSYRLP